LSQGHPSSCGRAELFALSWTGFGCGGRLCRAARKHSPEFRNLNVDLSLLFFKANYGSFDDWTIQFRYWHVFLPVTILTHVLMVLAVTR
jgi:hypothetical protein